MEIQLKPNPDKLVGKAERLWQGFPTHFRWGGLEIDHVCKEFRGSIQFWIC